MELEVAACTHPGRVRPHNEDAFLVASLDGALRVSAREVDAAHRNITFPLENKGEGKGVLVALSDGMGGAAAGELASSMSLQVVYDELVRDGSGDRTGRLRRVVRNASKRVREEGLRTQRAGMGATLTAALVSGTTAHIAQVGDSRAYLFRRGELRQVTHDQSYVQLLVDAGVISEEEAAVSPMKNVILEAMGSDKDPKVEVGKLALEIGDRLLLCSDGLTNAASVDRIRKTIANGTDLAAICSELLVAAIEGGAPDNVTAILAELR
jgi:serine/threonine protein phosphatase PrpC